MPELNVFSISTFMPVMLICQVIYIPKANKNREEIRSTNSLQTLAPKFSIWQSSLIKRLQRDYADWLESVLIYVKKILKEGLGWLFCRIEGEFCILAKGKWLGGYLHIWYTKVECFSCSIFGCKNLWNVAV